MHDTYARLAKEGKIGPFDAQGVARPFQEYPKWVDGNTLGPDGKPIRVIVDDRRAELAMAAQAAVVLGEAPDPVVAENNELRQQLAAMQAQLDRLGGANPEAEPAPAKSDEGANALGLAKTPAQPAPKKLTI